LRDDLKQIGFVAQELEQVFPNLIDDVPDFDAERNPTGEVTKGVKLYCFYSNFGQSNSRTKSRIRRT